MPLRGNLDLSRILAHLSHELRAPVGVALGYLRLLEQSGAALDEQQRHTVAAAVRAGLAAARLLDDASELSRLAAGYLPLNRTPRSLASLLNVSAQSVVLPEDPVINVEVSCVTPLVVSVDEPRMRPALGSLFTSVVRGHARAVTIEISAAPVRAGGQPYARIIAAPQTASRLKAREKHFEWAKGGHGLQLAIAVATVEAHGGRVRARHLGDRESGVLIRLPLAE